MTRTDSPIHFPLNTLSGRRLNSSRMNGINFAASVALASVPVLEPIDAPILRRLDNIKVDRFLKERLRYEVEISMKQGEVPSLRTLSHSASIDKSLLKPLLYIEKFDTVAPTATSVIILTKNGPKDSCMICCRALNLRISTPLSPSRPLPSSSCRLRYWTSTFVSEPLRRFLRTFVKRALSLVRRREPKTSVRLLCSPLKQPIMNKDMSKRLVYEVSLEKSVKTFIKPPIEESINCKPCRYCCGDPTKVNRSHQ